MKTIASKITKILIFIGIFAIAIGLTISYFQNKSVEQKQIELRKNALIQMVDEKLWKKKDVGLTNAVGFAANGTIKQALKTSNRELAIKELKSIGDQYKKNTNFKGIKIHLHTANMQSFVRSWKINSYGDDLSLFRHSIKELKNSKKAGVYYELGKSGMFIRGIVPITENNTYLGSLEFMQGVGSVNRDFSSQNMHYMMLLNEKSIEVSKKVKNNKKFGNLYVSNMKWFKPKTLEFISNINIDRLKKDGYYFDEQYFATILPLKDITGTIVGYHIIGESSENILASINKVKTLSYTYLTLIITLVVIIILAMIFIVNRTITQPLKRFQNGLNDFFKFINREQNSITKLDDSSQDEIGYMSKQINQNLKKIENDTIQDLGVFGEVMSFSEKVASGNFTSRIHLRASNGRINHIVNSLNDMGEMLHNSIGSDMNKISNVLESYGKYDFRPSIENPQGDVEKTTNLLGTMISSMLVENRQNGIQLERFATTLTNNVNTLNQAANKQAVSLEETAASAEEITSLIQQSTQKAESMSDISNITKTSATQGKELATNTAVAMDEINDSTIEIEEAITIIDQIAFQTNILSLNAAVEAATAGEAGKGFAVVAGEVRNLANRSAEAAKEIKNLVEKARQKADEGKKISEDMAIGYSELEKNIEQTNELIADVTDAAKEQLAGMNQINDSMTSLDITTQDNARMAAETNQIAHDTESIAKTVVSSTDDKQFEGKSC